MAQFYSQATEKFINIMGAWISDDHSMESAIVVIDIWGIGRREWEGLLTPPFWQYLLKECLLHIEQNNYHVAILLSATAVEWFVNRFLDFHLKHDYGWSNSKTKNILKTSLIHKVEVLGDVLEIEYDQGVCNSWSGKVRGPRNDIIHGTESMYGKYQKPSSFEAVISASKFILDLLEKAPVEEYVERPNYWHLTKRDLKDSISHLISISGA
ncbi:MAG: hypothetical protein ACFB0C_10835 [Leptolyngbyaceae cyanobacterium]